LAPRFSIEPRLALAIATTESNFDPNATSPKNAMGVMQLIPETASRFNVKDTFDPVQNIKGGLAYLRWLLAYYRGNVALAVAGYNAGEGAVDRYRGVPPFKETQNYVKRILEFFPRTEHPFDARVVDASPVLQALKVVGR
ncbi:MAG: lytic transglycosylase domain-containing protein, partial [Rhodocyclaceae bacterium]